MIYFFKNTLTTVSIFDNIQTRGSAYFFIPLVKNTDQKDEPTGIMVKMEVNKLTTALGKAIKRHRLWKDLSQTALAELVGVSSGYISELERGKQNPGFKTLARIANALEMPLWQLIKTAEEETDNGNNE